MPRRRFDTAYLAVRKVHVAVSMVEWGAVRYSVPPAGLGQRVEVRHEVDAERIEITWAGELVATHRIPTDPEIREVWDGGHFDAAQTAAVNRHRPALRVVPPPSPAGPPARLELCSGDYDVDPPDLGRYNPDQEQA